MGIIDDVYRIEPQNSALWDLKFIDQSNGILENDFHMRIVDCSIPFYKLIVEKKLSGEKVYKELQDVESVTFTIREDVEFNTYKFFQQWFDCVYDINNRVFKTAEVESTLYRNLQVIFYKPNVVALDMPFSTINLAGIQSIDLFAPVFPMKPSYQFNLRSCRIIGLGDLSLSYDGGPLTYSVEVAPQRIDFIKATV